LYTRLRSGFLWEERYYPCEYTEGAKLRFLEIESYLKTIQVPEITNHWEYYRKLKSKPCLKTNKSCYPGIFSGELSMYFENYRYE